MKISSQVKLNAGMSKSRGRGKKAKTKQNKTSMHKQIRRGKK